MGSITTEERQMIDAAIASGKVQKVEAGRTGFPEYRWDKSKNQLVAKDPTKRGWKFNGGHRNARRVSPEVAQRRMKIYELFCADKSNAQIAAELGLPQKTIENDISAMRKKGFNMPKRSVKQTEASRRYAERASRLITEVYDGLRTNAEISRITGLSENTVSRYVRKLGLRDKFGARPLADPRLTDRAVREYQDCLSVIETARRCGCAPSTVRKHLDKAGVERPRRWPNAA